MWYRDPVQLALLNFYPEVCDIVYNQFTSSHRYLRVNLSSGQANSVMLLKRAMATEATYMQNAWTLPRFTSYGG